MVHEFYRVLPAGVSLRVLVACEYSGTVREAFKELGHYAMSCDLLDTEIPGNHLQCDVREILGDGWDMMIAPVSFRFCSPEDIADRFYTAECGTCGWWGSSKLLDGGGAIADTGDHFDCTCPVCGNADINEKDDESKT